jgi:hypothetical protein
MTLPPPQADVRILERFPITAPLGVRFWDVVSRVFVRSGMRVTAYDTVDTRLSWRALETGGGVSVLRDLRGLRDLEQSDGAPDVWAAWAARTPPTIPRSFQLEVRDPSFRYQPFTCLTDAPQRGFADWMCPVSPPASHRDPDAPARSLPVFPTPARPVPGGYAVVRAQLVEPDASPPLSPPAEQEPVCAAWAFVEVWAEPDALGSPPPNPKPLGASYADEKGRVAVMFPWPAPVRSSLLSPQSPPGGSRGLLEQRWRIRLEAFYDRLDRETLPDLCAVLSQRRARLWDGFGVPFTPRSLEFNRELIVRSDAAQISELYITPGP